MYQSGTAIIKDKNAIMNWASSITYAEAQNFKKHVEIASREAENGRNSSRVTYAERNTDDVFAMHGSWYSGQEEEKWARDIRPGIIRKYSAFLDANEILGQKINVGLWLEDDFAYLYYGNKEKGVVIPTAFLEYIPERDFSGMTPAQVKATLELDAANNGMDVLPVEVQTAITTRDIHEQIESGNTEIGSLEDQIRNVKNAATEELAALKEEIRKKELELQARKDELLAELSNKKATLEIKMEEFKTQLYMLESQIYAIECYAGEVIQFAKIRSGDNAPDDVPVVIHQKFRFLDEELGKLASLYNVQWDEMDMFESFLQHHPLALETFAPEDRCVVLVRLSRTGTTLGASEKFPYQNIMSEYEYYHGKTVGIIIRNGDNLYMGWTDEEKVHLSDNLIFGKDSMLEKPAEKEIPEFESEVDRLNFIKENVKETKAYTDEIINRAYIFNILQGVIDHSDMLPLPEGTNLFKPSPLVVFSMADNWIADTRFGSFTEILEKSGRDPKKGDMILTMQRLYPEHGSPSGLYSWTRDRSWENVRGRGDRNRTHDCSADDNTIYPINLVEYDDPVTYTRYRIKGSRFGDSGLEPCWTTYVTQHPENLEDAAEILDSYTEIPTHVFISVEKTSGGWGYGYRGEKVPRANFELYSNEYINLTYLNSVWLEWVVTNRSLGDWRINGKPVMYAYGIRYLKTALDYIKKREEQEKKFISAVDPAICEDPDWPLKLSEWKIKKSVRQITEYQAKRFALWYNEQKK